jgi:hypothetical protein
VVKAYCVISLLKCLGKVIKKLAIMLIMDFIETQGLFYEGQFRDRC